MPGFGIGISPAMGRGAMAAGHPGRLGILLAAWEADFGVTLNGGSAASWSAKYGSGVLAQGTAASQPTFTANRGDGRPELLFDGVDDTLVAVLSNALPADSFGVVMAGKLASSVSSGRIIEINVGGDTQNQALYLWSSYSSSTTLGQGIRSAGSWGAAGSTVVPGASSDRFALAISRNGSTWTTAAKGVTGGGTLAGSVSGGNTVNIGQGSGVYFGGTLSALWVFSGPIDAAAAIAAMQAKFPNL